MTDTLTERILQQLQALRSGQEALSRGQEAVLADLADVGTCVAERGSESGFLMSQMAYLQLQIASQTSRIDRFGERLGRIEREIAALPAL